MSEKNQKAATCGCARAESAHGCPCKKRFCLPILGLVGLALVASVAAKRRKLQ